MLGCNLLQSPLYKCIRSVDAVSMRLGRYAFREHIAIKRGKNDTQTTCRDLGGPVTFSALCRQRMVEPRVAPCVRTTPGSSLPDPMVR